MCNNKLTERVTVRQGYMDFEVRLDEFSLNLKYIFFILNKVLTSTCWVYFGH